MERRTFRLIAVRLLGLPAKPLAKHFPVGIYAIPEVSMVGATEQLAEIGVLLLVASASAGIPWWRA